MKLEIDIPSIIYNDAKENRCYISVDKMGIAWKAIANGKPLEQEPVLDKIREEAIENLKILKEDYWDDDGYGHETKQYDDTMLALDMAIKVLEQEPRKGHWIKTSLTEVSGGDFKRGFKCSHCNYVIVTNDFNFCPSCGADMREVKE